MPSPAGKVRRVYREEGAVSLARQATAFVVNQARHRLREAGWYARGERTFSVGGVETTFRVGNLTEARGLRYLADHERPILADVLAELEPHDAFLDVGANVGFFTCFAADLLPPDRVVAVEPSPPNAARVLENLERNGRDAHVLEVALGDEPGRAALDRAPSAPGDAFAALSADEEGPVQVEVETGDALVERGEVPHPTVVKIDVEGAEPLVVEGMAETLADPACRLVYCEVHRGTGRSRSVTSYGGTEATMREALSDLGFAVRVLADREDEVYLKAERTGAQGGTVGPGGT